MRFCLALLLLPTLAFAEETVHPADTGNRRDPVVYEKDVAPIFASKCYACHSGSIKRGSFDMSSYELLMKGGRSGPVVVPGKAGESLLVLLAGKIERPFMPPKTETPLTPEELALVKLWIDQGARRGSGVESKPQVVLQPLPPTLQTVRAVAVRADGTMVAAGRANRIHLFQTATGSQQVSLTNAALTAADRQPLPAAHLDLVDALAFSPDGKTLASGSFQEVALWDVATGTLRQRLTTFSDRILSLSFSPNGKFLAVGGGAPSVAGELKVVDTASGKIIVDIEEAHSDSVFGVCFSPDGNKVASGSADRTIKVFEIPSGKLLRTFEGHTAYVLDVNWRHDGKMLASSGADNVKLWNYETGEQPRNSSRGKLGIRHKKPVARLFLVNDNLVTCSGDQTVGIWELPKDDMAGMASLSTLRTNAYLHTLGVSADGKVIAAGGADGSIWLFTREGNNYKSRTLSPQ